MVRILEESIAERKREELFQGLVDITERVVGTHHVSTNKDLKIVRIHNRKLLVLDSLNLLDVNDANQLDLALDLAARYEQAFGEEYTVKKNY